MPLITWFRISIFHDPRHHNKSRKLTTHSRPARLLYSTVRRTPYLYVGGPYQKICLTAFKNSARQNCQTTGMACFAEPIAFDSSPSRLISPVQLPLFSPRKPDSLPRSPPFLVHLLSLAVSSSQIWQGSCYEDHSQNIYGVIDSEYPSMAREYMGYMALLTASPYVITSMSAI